MFCPKCSQLQPSEEMRFCSRCGFPLAGVAMLLEKDGVIPQLTPGQKAPSSRKEVMTESAIFTGIPWAVALGATLLFDVGGAFENVAKIGALLFFLLGLVGLLRFLYGFLFVKDLAEQPVRNALNSKASHGGLADPPMRAALPGQRDLPTDYTRRVNTREMVPQPSVTENTTRLLEEQPTDRSD